MVHLGVSNCAIEYVMINCDKKAAIVYTKNLKYQDKTKHINIKYNFIKDMIIKKEFIVH